MDQRGSLVDTNLRIYPSEKLIAFIETIPISEHVPLNILKYIKHNSDISQKETTLEIRMTNIHFTNADIEMLNKIKKITNNTDKVVMKENDRGDNTDTQKYSSIHDKDIENTDCKKDIELIKKEPVEDNIDNKEGIELLTDESVDDCKSKVNTDKLFLTTSDIDWIYDHINGRKSKGIENVPFLHELFQGTYIDLPENRIIKRNPVLEARCVKLRAQQEAREYRKMTKGVDNVRIRFPEDSISYQLKQMNRQLIAIGQFIISIFAGFLFGFRGVEWMVGNLDFGVRLLLGVMCALIIALAEIYFLAKKLNEELTMTETVQLGGPPKFANQPDHRIFNTSDSKEHQD